MEHITSLFHAFQKVVAQCIKTLASKMKNTLYFSDRAASYYKCRTLLNEKNYFGIDAE
jgi:hypothetical protein